MTMPDRPLNLRAEDLSLDDTEWMLTWMETARADAEAVRRLRAILASASDWTEEEVGKLTWRELARVLAQVRAAQEVERDSAVPLPTGSNSQSGPTA